jgi:hypothetical protein
MLFATLSPMKGSLVNSQEEFLPKWYPSTEPKSKVTENFIAVTLLVLLTIFTLGIFTGLQQTTNTLKRRD